MAQHRGEAASPVPPGRLFAEALACQRRGQAAEAARLHDAVLRHDPNHLGALQMLAVLQAGQGRFDHAAELLQRAAERSPDAADIRNNLGLVLKSLGRHQEAIEHFRRALAIDPRYAVAHNNLGITLASAGQAEEAISHYRRAIALKRDYIEAYYNLGNAFSALRRYKEAIENFRGAIALRPDFAEAHANLGSAMAALDSQVEAVAHFEKALAVKPDLVEALTGLGKAEQASGRYESAIARFERASKLHPALASPHILRGRALQEIGHIAEARTCFERALALDPRDTAGYLNLVAIGTLADGDPRLAAMEELAREPSGLSEETRIDLHFALGKALADAGRHRYSFDHYRAANALKRRRVRYDEPAVLRRLQRSAEIFTAEFMRSQEAGDLSPLPVFVLGMPRSGSTLVEQILASHPRVFAAGEREDFRRAIRAAGLDGADARYPESATVLRAGQVRDIAAAYLASLGAAVPPSVPAPITRVTDKMPANFRYLGLVRLALPNARIIHTCRDPIDTCLSCFATAFEAQPFAFDLGELGRYFRAYAQLMAHWRTVLPPGAILDVHYEDLVADFDAQARRIINYCGLDWDDACLSFHEAKRPVRTASVAQVRQPLYKTSVGRWRPEEEILRPLIDGLGSDIGSILRGEYA